MTAQRSRTWSPTATPRGVDLRTAPPWLTATVVLDVMNVAHTIADLVDGEQVLPPIRPSLERIRVVLRHHGIEATRIIPVLATERLRRLGDDARGDVDDRVGTARTWVDAWAVESGAAILDDVRTGAFHDGEWGVDELCVATTLMELWTGRAEAVVLMSRDADVIAAAEVAGAPVLIVHPLSDGKTPLLNRRGIPYVRLSRTATRCLAPDGPDPATLVPVRIARVDGGVRIIDADAERSKRRSSDLSAPRWDRAFVDGNRRACSGRDGLAVVDTHGLLASAADAVGVARLPGPDDVDVVLEAIGIGGRCAQIAVIPDLYDTAGKGRPTILLGRGRENGRAAHDEELDRVAAAYERDGDPATVMRRARYLAVDSRTDGALVEKQTSTLLTAALVWALVHPDARELTGPIVLLSDRPELALVLERLAALGVVGIERVVRVGLHADPIDTATAALEERLAAWRARPADGAGPSRREQGANGAGHLVVLDGALVERLVRLDGARSGPVATALVADGLTRSDVLWRFVGFDPTIDGCIIESVDSEASVRARVAGAWAIDHDVWRRLEAGAAVPGAALDAYLVVDPDRPCEAPRLVAGDGAGGAGDGAPLAEVRIDVAALRSGTVVGREPGAVAVDVDGDGAADVAVPARHGTVRRGDLVHLHGHSDDLRLIGVEPADGAAIDPSVGALHVVTMVDGTHARLDGRVVRILPLAPGPPLPAPGEALLASVLEDDVLQALSTGLPHLRAGAQRSGD